MDYILHKRAHRLFTITVLTTFVLMLLKPVSSFVLMLPEDPAWRYDVKYMDDEGDVSSAELCGGFSTFTCIASSNTKLLADRDEKAIEAEAERKPYWPKYYFFRNRNVIICYKGKNNEIISIFKQIHKKAFLVL